MSASLLREAAAKMRLENMAVRRPYGRDEMFRSAVADWLHAVEFESMTEAGSSREVYDAAVSVARAYLGGDQ